MKAPIFFSLFLALFITQANGQISFFHGTWEEALKKAKAENKLIFVDAYASWCGPCKWMARNAFQDGDVGKFFNDNFINVKMDMERGEGPTFAGKYPVRAYPTLMFIDGDGKQAHKMEGALDASQLLSLGKSSHKKYAPKKKDNNDDNNNNNNDNNKGSIGGGSIGGGSIGGGGSTTKIRYTFSAGAFQSTDGGRTWREEDAYGRNRFSFKKQSDDDTYTYILDESRGVYLALPKGDGMSYVMRDGEWAELYKLDKK